MPTNPLRTDYTPNKAYKVAGEVLNRQNAAVNAQNAGHVIQRGASGINAAGIAADIPAPLFLFGIAEIIGVSNSCPAETGETGSQPYGGAGFPCNQINHYTCEFRYWNSDEGKWLKYGETLDLDANAYYEASDSQASQPSSGPGYGPIPGYYIGDTTPAYLDVQRNKLIPVQSPPSDPSTAVFYTDDDRTLDAGQAQINTQYQGYSPNTQSSEIGPVVEFYLELFRAGVDNDFRTVATASFPLPPAGVGSIVYDSRVAFNTVPAPHGSLFRVRAVRGAANPDVDTTVKMQWQRLELTGLGRRSPTVVANCTEEPSFTGGVYSSGWRADAGTLHRYKDAPTFSTINDQTDTLIQVDYFDPKDQWMIKAELYVNISIKATSANASSESCCKCKRFQTVYSGLQQISVDDNEVLAVGDSLGQIGASGVLGFEARFDATSFNDGQSFNIDGAYTFPKLGVRLAGTSPGGALGTAGEASYAKGKLKDNAASYPVNTAATCEWVERMGSPSHTGVRYYAKDISCRTQASSVGVTVKNPVDLVTQVIFTDKTAGIVILEHHCDCCALFKNNASLSGVDKAVADGSVLRVTGCFRTGGAGGLGTERKVYVVDIPNSTFQRNYLVSAAGRTVQPDRIGCGDWLDCAGKVLYEQGSLTETISIGDSYGAQKDKFTIVKKRSGFTVYGAEDGTSIIAKQEFVDQLWVKPVSDISAGGFGNAVVWMRNKVTGDREATEYTIEVNAIGNELAQDLFCLAFWDSGQWSSGEEC